MKKLFLFFAFPLILISCVSGCAMVSVSDEELNKIGNDTAKGITESYGNYTGQILYPYVEEVGKKIEIAASVREPLKYYILDTDMVNAFSVPGGHIFVTRGLLCRVNSEAELAMVLGHETGHLMARHSAKTISRIRTSSFFTNVLSIFASLYTKDQNVGSLVGTVMDISSVLVILNYGREAEFEADALGIKYAAKAGYDPEAGRKFLNTLESMEKDDKNSVSILLSTHPPTDERVTKARQLVKGSNLASSKLFVGDNAYKLKIKGIVVGPSLESGFIKDDVYYNKNYMFTLKKPDGWRLDSGRKYKGVLGTTGNIFLVYVEKPVGKPLLKKWSAGLIKDSLNTKDLVLNEKEQTYKGIPAYYYKQEIQGMSLNSRFLTFSKGDTYYALIYVYQPNIFADYDSVFEKLSGQFEFMDEKTAQGISEEHMNIYKAQAKDTWESLAQKFYSDPKLANKLSLYNGFDKKIEENEVIKLPPLKYLKKV